VTTYTIPKPTSLEVVFRVPASFTDKDIEALAWLAAGNVFYAAEIVDWEAACGSSTVSIRITLKRLPPVVIGDSLNKLYAAAGAPL